jgi:hypothetical protein
MDQNAITHAMMKEIRALKRMADMVEAEHAREALHQHYHPAEWRTEMLLEPKP